jgi:small subunit ribosomal protein S6e
MAAEFKLVISDPKTRKAYQVEVKSPEADRLIGKRIGEKVTGETINLSGFEFQITGGSDKQGFPMRPDIMGTKRIRALIGTGPGIRNKVKGGHLRKSVRGSQISEDIAQINMKLIAGEKSLAAALGKEEKKEEPAEKSPEAK